MRINDRMDPDARSADRYGHFLMTFMDLRSSSDDCCSSWPSFKKKSSLRDTLGFAFFSLICPLDLLLWLDDHTRMWQDAAEAVDVRKGEHIPRLSWRRRRWVELKVFREKQRKHVQYDFLDRNRTVSPETLTAKWRSRDSTTWSRTE